MARNAGMTCMFCESSPCECNKPAPKARAPRKVKPVEAAPAPEPTTPAPAPAPASSPMASGAMAAAAASHAGSARPSTPHRAPTHAATAHAPAPAPAPQPVAREEADERSLADKYPHDPGDEEYKAMRVLIESGILHSDDQAALERKFPVRYPPQLRAAASDWKKEYSGERV